MACGGGDGHGLQSAALQPTMGAGVTQVLFVVPGVFTVQHLSPEAQSAASASQEPTSGGTPPLPVRPPVVMVPPELCPPAPPVPVRPPVFVPPVERFTLPPVA